MDIDGTSFNNQGQTNPFVYIVDEQQQPPMLSSKSVAETHHSLQYPYHHQDSKSNCEQLVQCGPHNDNHNNSSSSRTLNFELRRESQLGRKRSRSASETQDHIMSERRRRQEMAERFIALAAIIPGLKKIDKASVLRETVSYVKQLQERITVLEQAETETKSMISIWKSHPCSESSETNFNDGHDQQPNQVLPDVEVIGLEQEKEVVVRIHCGKRKGMLLKLLALLENIHLSIASTSVLPFGKNTVHISIVAQMGEEYNMTVNELVKNLRQELLKLSSDDMEL